jgi:hypothetical protein
MRFRLQAGTGDATMAQSSQGLQEEPLKGLRGDAMGLGRLLQEPLLQAGLLQGDRHPSPEGVRAAAAPPA